MASVWCMFSTKGGVGKTTVTAVLAGEINRLGGTVTVIDTDQNQPLALWAEKQNLPAGIQVVSDHDDSGRTILKLIDDAKQQSDFVLIDTEGSENIRAAYAAQAADYVIVPMQFSELDLVEARKVSAFLDGVERATQKKRCHAILPTRVGSAIISNRQRQILQELQVLNLDVISPGVIDKEVYRLLFTHGCTLQNLSEMAKVHGLDTAAENAGAVLNALAGNYSAQREKIKNG
jgi:chromosome partitioning protein